VAAQLPSLRPAERRGLVRWVYGAILAGSACQTAVVTALRPLGLGSRHALRQRLREWSYDGADRVVPSAASLDVRACFAPLLRWIVTWWRSQALALAVDATNLGDRVVVVALSVLYRGCAIPVAWHVQSATAAGSWMEPLLALLTQVRPAAPADWTVLVLADRGLWSPQLWDATRAVGWHPVLRLQRRSTFRPTGQRRQRADRFVPGPGHAWVGAGTAFKDRPDRRDGTLIVVWDVDAAEPWVLLTDLAPADVGVCWYGVRAWIELGFRALKRLGWHWERTRRTEPARVARQWLVLAVATLWVLATGTRVEDAEQRGGPPARLRIAVAPAPRQRPRQVACFGRGLAWLRWQLLRVRRPWAVLWLWPDAWPATPPRLSLVFGPPAPPLPP
jgi:hypothetical protein